MTHTEPPDILHVDKDDTGFYDSTDLFPGKGQGKLSNTEKFMLALAYGFRFGAPKPLKQRDPSGFTRYSYLQPTDKALIFAIVTSLQKLGLEVLTDQQQTYEIAEQLAHAGAQLIQHSDMFKHSAMNEALENLILDVIPQETPSRASRQ